MQINLAVYRKRIGISQRELAERMGVTYQAISQYERGKREPKIEQVQRLCDVLGCTLDELLSDIDTAQAEPDRPINNRIREIRKAKGMTQQDVANALGTVKSAVSEWETSHRGISAITLCRLADLLSVTTDALLGREPIPTNPPTTEGGQNHMITLNDLLTIVDARQLRVVVPVTPRLKARITVNTRQTAELDDIIRLYGERPVFSAEPAHEGDVMEIELTDRKELARETVGV